MPRALRLTTSGEPGRPNQQRRIAGHDSQIIVERDLDVPLAEYRYIDAHLGHHLLQEWTGRDDQFACLDLLAVCGAHPLNRP